MLDLFRFISLRPPQKPDPLSVINIGPSPGLQKQLGRASGSGLVAEARTLLASGKGLVKDASALAYGKQYQLFVAALDGSKGPLSGAAIDQIINQVFGLSSKAIVTTSGFKSDMPSISDTLILAKLASNGTAVDIGGLNNALRAITVIQSVASGNTTPDIHPVFAVELLPLTPAGQPASPAAQAPANVKAATSATADFARAIQVLRSIPSSALHETQIALGAGQPQLKQGGVNAPRKLAGKASLNPVPAQSTILTVPPNVLSSLDPAVQRVAKLLHLDLTKTSVPQAIETITLALKAGNRGLASSLSQINAATANGSDPGTGPVRSLPTVPSSVVTPVGIGDLLVVKQRLKRYEGADVAYIENVLRTESFKRDTRRVQKTQVTVMTETDVTQEEERDTQTTDRFSLQRESANTIKEDSSLKAGLSVSASYGPTVSVQANLDTATNSSQEDSTKVATSYSKDVTTRAASKITTTTKQQQTMLTSDEYDEDVHHGFDNTAGAQNISGIYQWVDKVYEAQVYNYGVRMMFDVMVPEPAAFLISQLRSQSNSNLPSPPPPFTTLPWQIDDVQGSSTNYEALAEPYGTTNLDPPPDFFVTVAAEFAMDSLDSSKASVKDGEMKVPDGYQAYSVQAALWVSGVNSGGQSLFGNISVSIGSATLGSVLNKPMQGEIGPVPVTLEASETEAYTAAIELTCQRTDRAFHSWQEKVHAAIMQDYQRLQDAYQKAVSDAANSPGGAIQGQNPAINQILTQNELKKGCITLVTGQQYESFGAVELSNPESYPQIMLSNVEPQGKYVRFLEEAFEWENMTFFFYPYYWGRKGRWPLHVLATDPDPQFSDFLNAGFARVVFPVRPGFNEAVLHLLETGEIWDGGDVPTVNSQMYVSIIKEIQAQEGAPGSETPQGDPWEVTLPTTLVKLRADDKLPSWGWDNSNPPEWIEIV
jgi:hypothetical protein